MKKGYKALLAEAEAEVETLPVEQALRLPADGGVVFVDLRDPREEAPRLHEHRLRIGAFRVDPVLLREPLALGLAAKTVQDTLGARRALRNWECK